MTADNERPPLDSQMHDALIAQRAHVAASQTMDRRGWTSAQYLQDARTQFEHIDGSVCDLVNGHVMALLEALDEAERQIAAARVLGEGWVGFDDSHQYGDALLKVLAPTTTTTGE